MKKILDELQAKYETKDFIANDPIQFPHLYKKREDIELAGFISSAFACGKREVFIQKLKILFAIMQNEPYNFILEFEKYSYLLDGFIYRFIKDFDLKAYLLRLSKLYLSGSNLEELFSFGAQNVCDYFYKDANLTIGYCHLNPNPKKGCALKRYNMFLRWMIRKSQVDIGIWSFMDKKDLLIPLDTHVARISRRYGLLHRKSDDMRAVIELTNKLKEYDENDPTKYDFALFGLGIDENKK